MNNKIYIGIDLHKRSQTWVVLGEKDNSKLLTKTYHVTKEDISTAYMDAKKFGNELIAFIEPVCGWIWVVRELRKLGIEVHISNPRKIRMIADSLKKTDEEDAFVLAKLLKIGDIEESYECSPETRKHRSLCRERCFLVKTRSAIKCRLESVVTRDGNHTFLKQAKNRTQVIIEDNEFKVHNEVIESLDKSIEMVEKEINKNVPITEEMKRIKTIPGIGEVTARIICSEIGNFSNFKTPQQLASFAGLTPRERSSGGKKRLGSITHAGSKHLRYILVEAAMRIRNVEATKSLYDFYKRIKERGSAMKARVALARKLIIIIWHMINKKEDYLPS